MKWLVTSDTHLTDRPRDAYRFGLFAWLAKQQAKYDVDATFVLGDITDSKDRHPASLVNRVVDEITGLRPPVYILAGNHDYIRPDDPFFRFLSCIEGVEFVVVPTFLKPYGVAMVPHCRDQAELEAACGTMPPNPKAVFYHGTLDGAVAETGTRLSGLSGAPIGLLKPRWGAWAGDVHRPQRCPPVTYVGAPFHVRFGDNYVPRVLLIEDGRETDLHFKSPAKWSLTVRDPGDIARSGAVAGDQVKLTIELAREEVVEWPTIKRGILDACKEAGLEVYGSDMKVATTQRRQRIRLGQRSVTNEQILTDFCKAEKVAKTIDDVGMDLLK